MAGPAQKRVQALKVVKATEAAVRRALCAQGYRAARISQLERLRAVSTPERGAEEAQDLRHEK